jgi:Domain of unknown function (DUF5615)
MRKGGRLKMPRPGEETRLFIRLYLDEDIFKDVARALRLRGFDAVGVHELSRQGLSDADHLDYAASEDRALFTFNAPDYLDLPIEICAKESNILASLFPDKCPLVRSFADCSGC